MKKHYSPVCHLSGYKGIFPVLFLSVIGLLSPLFVSAQTSSLWVGESYKCEASTIGLTSDVSWSTSGGYLNLSGSGLYRNVRITQYFSGTATVTCTWKYRLYSNDRWTTTSQSWSFRCRENPVSIYPSSLSLSPGESAYVNYSHQFENEYLSYANVYFSSSNSNVASVSGGGLVTANSPGTAYINVYSKVSNAAHAPYCTVTVGALDPEGVSLQESLELTEGELYTLHPVVRPEGASTSFVWTSDDESVATVNSSGTVRAVKAGTAMIKVTTSVGGFSAVCEVTVNEPPVSPASITLPDSVFVYRGFKKMLVPVFAPDNAETYCTWETDNRSVVTVDYAGKVTAVQEGKATVTATTRNGLEARCQVTVSALPSDMDEATILDRIVSLGILSDMTFTRVY